MNSITHRITNHRKMIVIVFAALALLSAFLMTKVSVNYNMTDYLPKNSQSTTAIAIMAKEFNEAVPNIRIMISDVTVQEALSYKEKLSKISGVSDVTWLDDVINLKEPLEMADKSTVESYYKDKTALISASVKKGLEIPATDAIYKLIGEDNSASGSSVSIATSQKMSSSESMKAIIILVPAILIILLVSTSSWIEPLLFLLTIGIAVLINMGTNIIFGEVSFITKAISPILQMAVSLDYAIFLLHSFEDFRKQTDNIEEAMRLALRRAFPAIAASAATTLFGFVALVFMNFRIGSDLGINLVKAIIFSFTSVMVFLPALTIICYKLIDKTRHKNIVPSFKKIGKGVLKIRIPALIFAFALLIPVFLAQSNNTFFYGTGSLSPNSRSGHDILKINEKFGQSTSIVLLVPRGDPAKESILSDELKKVEHVTSVISYATMVGSTIPNDYLNTDITNRFYSKNYSRIVIFTDTFEEGTEAFSVVKAVQSKTAEYYENSYSCGSSVNLYDMKNVVEKDTGTVNLIATVAIGLVLLLTFRSLILPLLLLFTIEVAIWINLSVPYFSGDPLCYIGFLVISTVQLGATVDYAILLTDNYIRNRREMSKKDALKTTLGENFISILVSGLILSSAGFCLAFTSSNPIVSELGMLLGRGTILSMIMVVCVLPALLLLFDKITEKTSLRAKYFKEN